MKKIFTLLFIGISLFGYAQSFQITDTLGVPISNGHTFSASISPEELDLAGLYITYLEIKNLTDSELEMKVVRTDIDTVEGMEASLCVGGVCSLPFVLERIFSVDEGSSESFSFDLSPNGNFGFSKFQLDFMTGEEKITLFLEIDIQPVGINENNSITISLVAYPNPVSENSMVNVFYTITDNNEPYHLAIRNILGANVLKIPLNINENTVAVNVSTLQPGVYFYAIENKNQIVIAKKMVVK